MVAQQPSAYPSKVDWWLAVLILAVPLISLATALALHASGDTGAALIGWVTLIGVIALYRGVVWPVVYELHTDELVIRFGLVRSRIPYQVIRSVTPSRSPLASPALSLDRLSLQRDRGLPVTISPADRSAFLLDLAARAGHLRHSGDRLVSD